MWYNYDKIFGQKVGIFTKNELFRENSGYLKIFGGVSRTFLRNFQNDIEAILRDICI